MKPSALIAIALVFGAIAAVAIARWVGVGTPAASSGALVVVAARQISPGSPITQDKLTTVVWPEGLALPGASSKPAAIEGRVARQIIYPGEPVLASKLAPEDIKGGLAAVISPGKVAITVRVNDVIAVAGFTLPGSFVDVLASTRDAEGQPFSRIVLSRVKVLAIAQDTTGDPAKPKVTNAVTLELSPAQAERLDLARSIGTLSLALRNELDNNESRSPGARLTDLSTGTPLARAPGETPRPRAVASSAPPAPVQQIRGVQR